MAESVLWTPVGVCFLFWCLLGTLHVLGSCVGDRNVWNLLIYRGEPQRVDFEVHSEHEHIGSECLKLFQVQ